MRKNVKITAEQMEAIQSDLNWFKTVDLDDIRRDSEPRDLIVYYDEDRMTSSLQRRAAGEQLTPRALHNVQINDVLHLVTVA